MATRIIVVDGVLHRFRRWVKEVEYWDTPRLDRWWYYLEGHLTDEAAEKVFNLVATPAEYVTATLCVVLGHDVIPDQCGMPKHDYCHYCGVNFPGGAIR